MGSARVPRILEGWAARRRKYCLCLASGEWQVGRPHAYEIMRLHETFLNLIRRHSPGSVIHERDDCIAHHPHRLESSNLGVPPIRAIVTPLAVREFLRNPVYECIPR